MSANILAWIFWFSVLLIGYTYCLYPAILLVWSKVWKTKRDSTLSADFFPKVTVVVAVYNEEQALNDKLINIQKLAYPKNKITFLFGSDGSSDRTNEILSGTYCSNVTLKAFPQRRGKGAVLNDIVPLADGEIIIFSDANTLFASDTIHKLVGHFVEPHVGAVCGELILESDRKTAGGYGESLYWMYENAVKHLEANIHTTVGATGAVYAIRKTLFRPLPTKAVPDDFIISMNVLKQGLRLAYDPKALAFEKLSGSVIREFQRKIRIAVRNFHGISEFAPLLHPRNGFVALVLWSRKIIRWSVPFLLLAMLMACVSLAMKSQFFFVLLAAQAVFYLAASFGFLLEKSNVHIGVLGVPYYFAAMNIALLVGFFKFLAGKQPFTWDVVR